MSGTDATVDLVALAGLAGEEALAEARRTLTLCNACRYCEGFCAVFPAMTRRREFSDPDILHLANLCHGCRGCYHACQYAPPHEFAINVPRTLAAVRVESYRRSSPAGQSWGHPAWGWAPAAVAALLLAILMLFGDSAGPADRALGGFYAEIGRNWLIAIGLVLAVPPAAGLMLATLRYRRLVADAPGPRPTPVDWIGALHDAATLRYLGGSHGEGGCNDIDESYGQARRTWHQWLAWGFVACFAATSVGAIYDHLFHWPAPYPLVSLPGLLGSGGGLAMVIGAIGLLRLKWLELPAPTFAALTRADGHLLRQLLLVAASGLALRLLGDTPLLGLVLWLHLSSIAWLFSALFAGKFIHAPLRLLALARDRAEARTHAANGTGTGAA